MNFTKEYIAEADCKEIQGLKDIKYGDWIYDISTDMDYEFDEHNCGVYTQKMFSYVKGVDIWLPTGDQLDDEIVKIIEVGINYTSAYCKATDSYVAYIEDDETPDDYITYYSTNPLMAKIKLLKVILEYK